MRKSGSPSLPFPLPFSFPHLVSLTLPLSISLFLSIPFQAEALPSEHTQRRCCCVCFRGKREALWGQSLVKLKKMQLFFLRSELFLTPVSSYMRVFFHSFHNSEIVERRLIKHLN